jgi:hypothetical protein
MDGRDGKITKSVWKTDQPTQDFDATPTNDVRWRDRRVISVNENHISPHKQIYFNLFYYLFLLHIIFYINGNLRYRER